MLRNRTPRLIVCLVCLTIASCATVVKEPESASPAKSAEPADWKAQQQRRQSINYWEVRGRLGVQTEITGGSMDIIWKNAGDDYSIRLIAPLGAGSYLIQGNSQLAEIRFPDGRIDTVDNIDRIFSSAFDIDLPASAVRDWIRGIPSQSMPVQQISWNKKGMLEKVKQSGWKVEMKRYTGAKVAMPYTIYVSHEGSEELDMRLVLRQWLIDN